VIEIGSQSIALFDLLVGGLLIVSGLFAFARGFTHEILSIGSWVGAVIITVLLFEFAAAPVRDLVEPQLLADGIVAVSLFIVSMALLSVLTRRIGGAVRGSAVGALDRTLGFFFGLLRGTVIVSALYLLLAYFLPPEEHPEWVTSGKSLPLVQMGARTVFEVFPHLNVPPALQSGAGGNWQDFEPFSSGADEQPEQLYDSSATDYDSKNSQSGADSGSETGYKDQDRSAIEQLIENTQ